MSSGRTQGARFRGPRPNICTRPADARSIEGLYECADGRWVHHWTVRPSWVLSSAEGDDLVVAGGDGLYRDDPDRISMEPDGLLVGTFLHPQLAEAFKKFPSFSPPAREPSR